MSHRLGHLGFDLTLGVPLDYLIHGFGGLGRVSGVLLLRGGFTPKSTAFVRFHIIINK